MIYLEREPEDGLYEKGYENIISVWPRRPNVCEIWSKGKHQHDRNDVGWKQRRDSAIGMEKDMLNK